MTGATVPTSSLASGVLAPKSAAAVRALHLPQGVDSMPDHGQGDCRVEWRRSRAWRLVGDTSYRAHPQNGSLSVPDATLSGFSLINDVDQLPAATFIL